MITETIGSFFDNVKQKFTNTFFGTLIFVWFVRNFLFVYTLFSFDENYHLNAKRKFILDYYRHRHWEEELFYNLFYAAGLWILGYVIIIITKIIINIIDYNLMPFIDKRTVSKLVINRKYYDDLKIERDNFADKYELEKNKVRNILLEYDKQLELKDSELSNYENRITQMSQFVNNTEEIEMIAQEKAELQAKYNDLIQVRKDLEKNVLEEKNKYNEQFNQNVLLKQLLQYDLTYFENASSDEKKLIIERLPHHIKLILKKFHSNPQTDFFEALLNVKIKKGGIESYVIKVLLDNNLINSAKVQTDVGQFPNLASNYEITEFGEVIRHYKNVYEEIIARSYPI